MLVSLLRNLLLPIQCAAKRDCLSINVYISYLIVEGQHVHLMSVVGREGRMHDADGRRLAALAVRGAPLRLPHAPAERVHHHFGRATAAAVHLNNRNRL